MSKPNIRLLADRVLVEVISPEEQKTKGGIIIPESVSKEKTLSGRVLGTSQRIKDCEKEEDKVYVDEEVLFSKYAGSEIEYKNKEYRVMRITDLFGVVDE